MARATSVNPTAVWNTLDPTTLPVPIAKQYNRYKSAYAEMKAERKAFEDALSALMTVPPGKRVVFGYNFGKLSVAIVDDTGKTVTTGKAPLTLADFLASQAAQGKRT